MLIQSGDMNMSEYVHCWIVQIAYNINNIRRKHLLEALLNISGAVKECPAWNYIDADASAEWDDFDSLVNRMVNLLPALQAHAYPLAILIEVFHKTYEGEKPNPEKKFLLGAYQDILERFSTLYFDSLLLRRVDVRAYCHENQIIQRCEIKGLMLENYDGITAQPSIILSPQPLISPSQKSPSPLVMSYKDDKIVATLEACNVVAAAIQEGSHLDTHGQISRGAFLDCVAQVLLHRHGSPACHVTTAKDFFKNSPTMQRVKRGEGRRKQK